MLNRLFVIIGFLVILGIGAAFVVPRLIQWSDYRGRLESMATQAFGADVAIAGDIELTLLPQPLLVFTDVRVGPEPTPAIQVARVEAQFSLFDFLSDRYRVTSLELEKPVMNVAIDADGRFTSGVALAAEAEQSNVSIASAEVVDGTIRLFDARSGQSHEAANLDGEVRLDALRGPFSFQGSTTFGGEDYALRVSTGRVDDAGAATLSVYVRPDSGAFTLESSGSLQTRDVPKFAGDLRYRQPPPRPREGEIADAGRGDLLLEGKVEAGSDRVLLSSYTLLPDENRAATRLTGAAELGLGREVSFNAVVSGGVISLPPRDATKELTDPPYELFRLLGELPAPAIPGVRGTVGLDVAEVNLRGVALRDVQLDATTDTTRWTIDSFSAALPGNTRLRLAGALTASGDHPAFTGTLNIASQQLDRLAALWRRPPADNPLFNMPGSLMANVELSGEHLALSGGTLVVAGINQAFDAAMGFGPTRDLALDAHFTTLGPAESAAVAALLPDLAGSGSFGATFPKGKIDISASKAVVFGLSGSELAVAANWEGGVLEVTRLSAGDLGGARFDGKLTAFGTLLKPEVSGSGVLAISDGAPIVSALLSGIAAPAPVSDFLHLSLPADLAVQLGAPNGQGGQTLALTGELGTAQVKLEAQLSAGVASALSAPIAANITLNSDSPTLMTMQLGLGDVPIFDARTPLSLTASIEGVPSNSYELHARLEGGSDHIGFDGNVVPGDFSRISGDGRIDVALSDASTLAEVLGAAGVHVPPVAGSADVQFSGSDSISITGIDAGGATGNLALTRREGIAQIEGELALASADVRALVPLVAGAASAVAGDGPWPEGPIDIGSASRASTGRIAVSIAKVTAGETDWLTDARFGFDWDAQSLGIRDFSAAAGDGRLNFDARVCCSNGALQAKRISGRLSADGVSLDSVLPPAMAAGLDGTLDASAAFDGTGATLAEAVAAMTGSGSYTVSEFSVAQFNPQTFNDAGALTGVVEMEPEALATAVTDELRAAAFDSNLVSGTFTVAGGILRSPNLAIAGSGARIFGGGNLSLRDLTIDARYAMTPTGLANPDGAVDQNSAEVAAIVRGPLWAPVASYDVAALVDGMKIKASEIELARLEQLRLEDERRREELAADRARVAAEQAAAEAARVAAEEEAARQAAEAEAARQAAADEAARLAAEEAARQAAEAERLRATPPAPRNPAVPRPPLDLGL